MKVSIASRRRNRQNIGTKLSNPGQADTVTITKIENVIQHLKQAKKTSGVKFVLIDNDNGNLTLEVASSSDILDIANPTKKQAKTLRIKAKKSANVSAQRYQATEENEAISAIKENLKQHTEANKDFFAKLNTSLLKI